MRRLLVLLLPLAIAVADTRQPPKSPADVYGELFRRVQMEQVFPDEKTFVDCIPKRMPGEILSDYNAQKDNPDFNLKTFVLANFSPSRNAPDIREHIAALWALLKRDASHPPAGSSLIALPRPYVVPGGRFEELYYWDSYFTMMGLKEDDRIDMIENMVDNFAHLITTEGFIPNANRTYYLSRSQPPFFSLMVALLADERDNSVYSKYRPALEKEHTFWTTGEHAITDGPAMGLSRYHDRDNVPREEQYRTDELLSQTTDRDPAELFQELRSACESGWDFSSRWFTEGGDRATIRTTRLVPVDLNCLLVHLERTIARARRADGDEEGAAEMENLAARRAKAINRLCWSDEWYVDYDLDADAPSSEKTLAGMMPFFLDVAPTERATTAAAQLRASFLKPGGLVTTLRNSGEQWDAPNGWAPLQWVAIDGLRNYDQGELAGEIADRWMRLNLRVYRDTGKLMEKYDVEDLTRPAGGGEYPTQDGFGWTNGVLLTLLNLYGEPPREAE